MCDQWPAPLGVERGVAPKGILGYLHPDACRRLTREVAQAFHSCGRVFRDAQRQLCSYNLFIAAGMAHVILASKEASLGDYAPK